ncbi:MAG: hypothetical protein IPK31_11425 [Chitinophagaceae bacterium]|nr:hypothetical protein [Chitinophagaceae bacterium]
MQRFRFLLPVAFLVVIACNNQESKKEESHDTHQKSEMKDAQMDNKEKHEETAGIIQLDSGKKWKANPETITGINNMSTLVQNGIAGKIEAPKIHNSLQAEFKTIFDKCTMKGESHNQLHNFLLPLKGLLDKLKTVGSDSNTLEEIRKYLLTFKYYFE